MQHVHGRSRRILRCIGRHNNLKGTGTPHHILYTSTKRVDNKERAIASPLMRYKKRLGCALCAKCEYVCACVWIEITRVCYPSLRESRLGPLHSIHVHEFIRPNHSMIRLEQHTDKLRLVGGEETAGRQGQQCETRRNNTPGVCT